MPERQAAALDLARVRESLMSIDTRLKEIDTTAKAAQDRAAASPTRRNLYGVLAALVALLLVVVGGSFAAYRSAQADLSRQVSTCFLATPSDQAVIDECGARFPGYHEQITLSQARLRQFQELLKAIPENTARIERLEQHAGLAPAPR